MIDLAREKLFNAIAHFVTHTRWCYKTKLFKLLFLLDFRHYQGVGRSVTGLHYNAWPKGPVPVSLYEEMNCRCTDLAVRFSMEEKNSSGRTALVIIPQFPFDATIFSRREARIMGDLSREFRNATAERMVEETHLENRPWHTVYQQWGDRQAIIPYSLALRETEREEMMELIRDRDEFLAEFGSPP